MSGRPDVTWGAAARAYMSGWRAAQAGGVVDQRGHADPQYAVAYRLGVDDARRKQRAESLLAAFRGRPGGIDPAPLDARGKPIIDYNVDA